MLPDRNHGVDGVSWHGFHVEPPMNQTMAGFVAG